MGFKENLEVLPVAEGARLVLLDECGPEVGRITNGSGTAGSFQVYAYLAAKYGAINASAAQEGLGIYAEHTEDARQSPGKHPNIDRLFEVLASGKSFKVEVR